MKIQPLLILLLAFFVGIIAERIFLIPPVAIFILLMVFLGLLFVLLKQTRYFILVLAFLFFLLGMFRLSFEVILPEHSVGKLKNGTTITLIGKIGTRPEVSSYGNTNFLLEAKRKLAAEKLSKASGKIQISCKGELNGVGLGDLVKVRGVVVDFEEKTNPIGFSLEEYNFSQGIYKKIFIQPKEIELLKRGKPPFFENLIFSLQQQIKHKIERFLPGYRDLLGSMLLGSRVAGLDREIKDRYKRAGVAHLLVASGMHLGIIVGAFAALLASFKVSSKTSFWVLTFLNGLYFLLAGAGTSIARASVMLQLALFSKFLDRDRDFFVSICLAAFLVLLRSPLDLFSAAFQLSFGATVGVVCVTPILSEKVFQNVPMPKWLIMLFSIALAPLLLTYPICAYNFNQISLVAFVTNLVVLPLVGGLVIFSAAALIVSFVFLPLSKLLGLGVYFGIFLMDYFVGFMSKISFAVINIAQLNLLVILLLYGAMYFMVKVLLKRGRKAAFLIGTALLVLFFVVSGFTGQKQLEILVLDVGQGDAILINTPNNKNILIDAGDLGFGKQVVMPVLKKRGVNKLELMILTHPHMDHMGGMPEVLEGIKVGAFYDPGVDHTADAYRKALKLIKNKNIYYEVVKCGNHFMCGDVDFYILGPPPGLIHSESYLNDNSVIVRVVYKDFSMLLTGDAEYAAESALLDFNIKSDVLKAGHHGSATASTWEFLEAVRPAAAIISCGKRNKFRHPHKAALENLEKIGAKIYRTDLQGAIIIKTNGEKTTINTMKN
ncbi:MAG: DNA internalization-related competence protein ComEC/Rec2 [Candidatus Margulisbacteria bacterium]|nr:DNA internalization-related competence protein ComEC/Rec2 [Candidatus Margulisiibacteriota bacterium]MBU1021376.1 DNA internalization-related competence protein ComEC/Rec2 [Candidatus Margulisiibacteriota bacterium]MBU1729135.1 DNA internalization-related competence protein ComEC/Rec2 [Candidatus Margulisiibacteriota bacterium]MBU1954808.1 DNA internalization-related competence protein ComEC/Rec2 [Candidatus Margulisiibacteriota bacterium]